MRISYNTLKINGIDLLEDFAKMLVNLSAVLRLRRNELNLSQVNLANDIIYNQTTIEMKTFFALIFTALIICAATSINNDKGTARVDRVQGIEFYVLSQPMLDYDVVEKMNTSLSIASGCSINNIVNAFANKAQRERKRGTDFDAVMLDGSNNGVLIKYKN